MDHLTTEILQIGHPKLRQLSEPVLGSQDPHFVVEKNLLLDTLEAFRRHYGFGRAIAAPQIGIAKRFIGLNLGKGPFVMINPKISWRSVETFTMWDDCMCFPFLMVKVRRFNSISVKYETEDGTSQEWLNLDRVTSELLQHEIDHLDGILATDRQEGIDGLVSRTVYEAERGYFEQQVDYVIGK